MAFKQALVRELRAQRSHVVRTITGVPAAALLAPVPPATWTPSSALHHLALDVERWWFQAIVDNEPAAWAYFDASPNGAWTVPDGVDVVSLYEAESAMSDAIIEGRDLDAMPEAWPDFLGEPQTLFEIIVHVIAETAAHAGQLDVVREAIDGHQNLILD